MSDAGKAVSDTFQSIGNALGSIGNTITNTINAVINNPLPVIEAIAVSYALGPEGLGSIGADTAATDVAAAGADTAAAAAGTDAASTALIQNTALRAAVTNAAVVAMNGGDINKMVLAIGSAYAGSYIGQYVGSSAATASTSAGMTQATTDLVKQVVTSASGQAATAALQGQSINQVMYAGIAGAASGAVTNELKAAGYTNVPTTYVANATAAATKAILNGQDPATAIQNSAKATTIAQAVSVGTDQLNGLQKTAQDFYKNTFLPTVQKAQADFTTDVQPLQDQYTKLQATVQPAAQSFNDALATYNNDVAQYNANNGDYSKTADQINAEGAALSQQAPVIQQQISDLNTLGSQLTAAQVEYKPLSDAAQAAQTQLNTYLDSINQQSAVVAGNVVDYQNTVTQDATNITQQLADETVKQAEQTMNSVAQAQGWKDYPTQQVAANAGFSDATTYATAQKYDIPTMAAWTDVNAEAQKSGWLGYDQQQKANSAGFTDPTTYETATHYGITTPQAWTAANADAQKAGWSSYEQQQTAKTGGFDAPTETALAYAQMVDAFNNPTGISEPAIPDQQQNPEPSSPLIPSTPGSGVNFGVSNIYENIPKQNGSSPLTPSTSTTIPATGTSTGTATGTNTATNGLTAAQLAILATPTIFTPDAPVVDTGAPKVNLAGLVDEPTQVITQNTQSGDMPYLPDMAYLPYNYGAPQDAQQVIYASPNEGETTTMAATGGSVDDLLRLMDWRV